MYKKGKIHKEFYTQKPILAFPFVFKCLTFAATFIIAHYILTVFRKPKSHLYRTLYQVINDTMTRQATGIDSSYAVSYIKKI